MALYEVAGLKQKIELPVPLIIRLVPVGQIKQRPGTKRQTPGYWVQHETGNYNAGAGAEMHCRYLLNGAEGQYLSFHFAVDDEVIYQMIPVDEVTYQAADGNGPGNMSGISSELAVNRDMDWGKARRNAEALAGGIMRALSMGADRLKRHFDFNASDPDRHYCPKEMMTSGYWDTDFVPNVAKIIGGNATVPEPTPTPPPTGDYPAGMDAGIASWLFGSYAQGGRVYQFDPKGPVSKAWLKYGARHGHTEIVGVWRFTDGREYFKFRSFTLWRPNGTAEFAPIEAGN